LTGRSGWADVRAALVALHVVVVTLSAIPSPEGGMDRKAWAEPAVQAELGVWADRLGMERAAFTERLWGVASQYQDALDVLLAPVRVYERATGTSQNWKMFVAPHRYPSRLRIEARAEDTPWERIYEARSDDAVWRRDVLDNERLRASVFRWSWPGYRRTYRQGCESLARRILAERSDVTVVRCSLGRARTPAADEVARGDAVAVRWSDTWRVER
jgi:hypothetical protein